MALLGTVLADAVVQLGLGERPMLQLSAIVLPSPGTIPAILCISAVAAFAGLLCNQALVQGVAHAPSKIPLWARGVVAGCFVGGCIYFVPMIVLDEQGVFARFSPGAGFSEVSILTLGGLFVGKLLITVACYATGVPGGIFAPMLVQGAFVGFLMAKVLALTPLEIPQAEVSALLGMTAFFAASVRAPFTGVVLLAEMTNGFSLLLPLMVAALVGYFIAELMGTKPIYERLLVISTIVPGRHPEGL
jgi:CIC family chloride channel protein